MNQYVDLLAWEYCLACLFRDLGWCQPGYDSVLFCLNMPEWCGSKWPHIEKKEKKRKTERGMKTVGVGGGDSEQGRNTAQHRTVERKGEVTEQNVEKVRSVR